VDRPENVLAAVGVSFTEQLAGDLKGQIGQHVALDDLVRIVNGAAGDDRRFDSSVEHQLRKIGSDIDLYCANLKRAAEQQGRTGPPIYNFHGPVAAVQTGPYSTASVVQIFAPSIARLSPTPSTNSGLASRRLRRR